MDKVMIDFSKTKHTPQGMCFVVHRVGLEPTAKRLRVSCSNQLSYRCILDTQNVPKSGTTGLVCQDH